MKDEGAVIACRPTEDGDFIYPLEQFGPGGIEEWARHVIRAVGNGAPALHFLYTKRASLDGRSFAEVLRMGGEESSHAAELLSAAAQRLTHETAQ